MVVTSIISILQMWAESQRDEPISSGPRGGAWGMARFWTQVLILKTVSHSVKPDSLQSHGLWSVRFFCSGRNSAVGSHFFLQGIFPTNGSNLGLLHCRRILYHLSHKGCLILGPLQNVTSNLQFNLKGPGKVLHYEISCTMAEDLSIVGAH